MKIFKSVILMPLMLIGFNASANSNMQGIIHIDHWEEKNVPLPENLKKISNLNNSTQASTSASANYATGYHGTNVQATGNVGYQIYNGSGSRQYYYIDIYMCIQNTSCMHTHDSYT